MSESKTPAWDWSAEQHAADMGVTPKAPEWCSWCNGYGSSFKDGGEGRCSRCGGTGLASRA
jgi:DnaJ-class molecular chaperone